MGIMRWEKGEPRNMTKGEASPLWVGFGLGFAIRFRVRL
jgi:hypothetical protein